MWPILTKVEYEALPKIFSARRLWIHIIISMILNWIVGPFLMLGLAWATLPDLPEYRAGVIIVGIARCIAMVMIWNQLARGDANYCAILVVINSVMQIVLFSPYSLLLVDVIGGNANSEVKRLSYGTVAISVLIVSCKYELGSKLILNHSTWVYLWQPDLSLDILFGISRQRNSSSNDFYPYLVQLRCSGSYTQLW